MILNQLTFQGPPIDDADLFDSLPDDYKELLKQINGFIQFSGGLHVRGVCATPDWHSLTVGWTGNLSLSSLYPAIGEADIPFGQDALGDQFVLRGSVVYRLWGETGELESLGCGIGDFLDFAYADPLEYLRLQPLVQFWDEGGSLQPGQLLSAYPPFCTKESADGVSLRAIPAIERIAFLADLASQISNVA